MEQRLFHSSGGIPGASFFCSGIRGCGVNSRIGDLSGTLTGRRMLPSIAPCEYPEGAFRGVPLPDHGELWSGPWKYEIGKGHLQVWSEPRCLPCIFRKRIRLDADSVLIEYEIRERLRSALPLSVVRPPSIADRARVPDRLAPRRVQLADWLFNRKPPWHTRHGLRVADCSGFSRW